ncbi:MAG: helix-turn-helix transcriptional regulator [Clostridia bacterium]|nr:helix-turn-helix transcriptional regulator [Clostridia bacterium]
MRDISKNIRQQRVQKHLTQDDLAERIHTTRQTVSNYETGRSRPDLDTLMLLAEVLECDTESLLYGKARPALDPREVRRLVMGLCFLGGVLLVQFVTTRIVKQTVTEHYQIQTLALVFLYMLQYTRTLLFGWCTVQGLTALRLFPRHPCNWLHRALWVLLALWPLYWLFSFAFSGQAPLWLTTITRLLLRLHLWPGYFVGNALTFCWGAAIRFTKS